MQIAAGLGAKALRPHTAAELRAALDETRGHQGTVVIVVPAIPHADLPPAGCWWDVAPAEVSEIDTVVPLRAEYEHDSQPNGGSGESAYGPAESAVPSRGRPRRDPHPGNVYGQRLRATAEVCAAAGFDWLLLIRARAGGRRGRDVVPGRRRLRGAHRGPGGVRRTDPDGRVLDAGRRGIMLPRMDSRQQVAELAHLRYSPPETVGSPRITVPAGSGSTPAPWTGLTMRSWRRPD